MNFLIADSGSTKTDWSFIKEKEVSLQFHTEGMNPYYHSRGSIYQILQKASDAHTQISKISRVYFYGSGCTDSNRNRIIIDALKDVFGMRLKVEVNSDLLGAARACCGDKKGIVCILGTGSNSCVYDGKQVKDQIPPLGFILGDEGSGAHIGKKLIQSYYYREMPPDLRKELEKKRNMSRPVILENIYNKRHANRFVSGFSKFCSEFQDHPFINQLIKGSFSEFLDHHITHYAKFGNYEISFAGSIAFYYKSILEDLFEDRSLRLGKVLKNPMDELVNYHR